MPTPIILDCDPGHDDAIAILLALASPEVELLGITTVHGNQTLDKTTVNALKVLELAGRADVPVARGAERPLVRELSVADHVHGESGLDGPVLPEPTARPVDDDAVSFLAERLGPGVVLCPTGSLTNIARLLTDHPGVRPERIVLMGGAIGLGNITPAAEFNIWADPEAATIVFESGIDITMVGLDVTHQAIVGPERVDRFRRMGRVGAIVAEWVDFYSLYHRSNLRVGRPTGPRRPCRRVRHPSGAAGDGASPRRRSRRSPSSAAAEPSSISTREGRARPTPTSPSASRRRPSSTCSKSASPASPERQTLPVPGTEV